MEGGWVTAVIYESVITEAVSMTRPENILTAIHVNLILFFYIDLDNVHAR